MPPGRPKGGRYFPIRKVLSDRYFLIRKVLIHCDILIRKVWLNTFLIRQVGCPQGPLAGLPGGHHSLGCGWF